MTEPADPSSDKRRRILGAAIRVFAARGYEGSRVGDIAKEAGVAYGLVYHYFKNKEEILNDIFETHWGVLVQVIGDIHREGGSLRAKLGRVASFIIEVWRTNPALVEVLILEIVRSPKFLDAPKLRAFSRIFLLLEEIIAHHQQKGEVRPEVNPRLAGFVFMGSLEILLTGFVTGVLEQGEDASLDLLRDTAVNLFLTGISGLAPE